MARTFGYKDVVAIPVVLPESGHLDNRP